MIMMINFEFNFEMRPVKGNIGIRGEFYRIRLDLQPVDLSASLLKPHCIQSSRVLVPAGTSKSTLRRHCIQAVTRVMAYVADAVTL
jgi:hypothetical protein